jgi:hypothetical protein
VDYIGNVADPHNMTGGLFAFATAAVKSLENVVLIRDREPMSRFALNENFLKSIMLFDANVLR